MSEEEKGGEVEGAQEVRIVDPPIKLADIEFDLDVDPDDFTINLQDKTFWIEVSVTVSRLLLLDDNKIYLGDEITLNFPNGLKAVIKTARKKGGWGDVFVLGSNPEREGCPLFMEISIDFDEFKFEPAYPALN